MKPSENPCPKCKKGEIVCYTKPDGNYICCDECGWSPKIK